MNQLSRVCKFVFAEASCDSAWGLAIAQGEEAARAGDHNDSNEMMLTCKQASEETSWNAVRVRQMLQVQRHWKNKREKMADGPGAFCEPFCLPPPEHFISIIFCHSVCCGALSDLLVVCLQHQQPALPFLCRPCDFRQQAKG